MLKSLFKPFAMILNIGTGVFRLRLFCFVMVMLVLFMVAGCQSSPVEVFANRSVVPVEPEQASAPVPDEEKRFPALPEGFRGPVTYEVIERMTITNYGPEQPSKHNLWVALIGDVFPYQSVEAMEISPQTYQIVEDEYGNHFAEFDLADIAPGTTIPVEIKIRVTVNALSYDLSKCEGDVPAIFTDAELHVESNNPQIQELSKRLSADANNACEQVRAFYDYAGDELIYSYNANDWGAQAALGEMGSDCTEYSSLVMALSRAAGLPARYLEGLSYPVYGAKDLARTEHSWLEVYLPGAGWTPMDPTMGRAPLSREQFFGNMPANHIIVTRGRNPSTLRGASYWTHLYWPGNSTKIRVENFEWDIKPVAYH